MDIRHFVYGGTASIIAEVCTFPIDTTKTRLQIQGEVKNDSVKAFKGGQYRGMLHAFRTIMQQEGLSALYRGLSAAVIRQASYGTLKMGLYGTLKRFYSKQKEETLSSNVACAVVAGVTSSAITNPTDVIKIRMQSKSNYIKNSTFMKELFATISKEGVIGLYKTVLPTAMRAALLVGVQLPAYDLSKRSLVNAHIFQGKDIACHIVSGLIAASCSTVVSCPVEMIRTRLMYQKWIDKAIHPQCNGPTYKNAFTCIAMTIKNEGVLAMWKGFVPMWSRIGPWNVIFFLTQEQLFLLDYRLFSEPSLF